MLSSNRLLKTFLTEQTKRWSYDLDLPKNGESTFFSSGLRLFLTDKIVLFLWRRSR